MATISYERMSLRDLLDHETKIKRAISAARERSKAEAKNKVDAMLKGMGLSFGEIYGGRGSVKGSKVAPKYRNPENPTETWTGRGRQPRWLAAKVKKGSKATDFLI